MPSTREECLSPGRTRPLEEHVQPVGGGFFFALPGVRGEDDWFGRAMVS